MQCNGGRSILRYTLGCTRQWFGLGSSLMGGFGVRFYHDPGWFRWRRPCRLLDFPFEALLCGSLATLSAERGISCVLGGSALPGLRFEALDIFALFYVPFLFVSPSFFASFPCSTLCFPDGISLADWVQESDGLPLFIPPFISGPLLSLSQSWRWCGFLDGLVAIYGTRNCNPTIGELSHLNMSHRMCFSKASRPMVLP